MSEEINVCPVSGKPCPSPKNYRIFDIVDGKHKLYQLCDKCGPVFFNSQETFEPEPEQSSPSGVLKNILSGLFSVINQMPEKCPNCGISINEIKKTHRPGCLKCYSFFSKIIDHPIIKKEIKSISKKEDGFYNYYKELNKKIQICIQEQKYEKAADLNAELKKIQKTKEELETKLDEAVKTEKYEQANEIKIQIDNLISQLKNENCS